MEWGVSMIPLVVVEEEVGREGDLCRRWTMVVGVPDGSHGV
jgi:hypothetical protein